jgi:hypothetical protein
MLLLPEKELSLPWLVSLAANPSPRLHPVRKIGTRHSSHSPPRPCTQGRGGELESRGNSWNHILLAGDCMRGCAGPTAGAEALTETQGQSDAPRGTGRLCLGELGASRFLRAAFWDSYRHAVGRCILAPLTPLSPLSPDYRGEGGNYGKVSGTETHWQVCSLALKSCCAMHSGTRAVER